MGKNKKISYTYFAFISYQRQDEDLAKRLQHTLEYYKLPIAVVEKEPSLKEGVRPIFVDMTELGDEPFLKPAIENALGSSRFLIVICSPRSAQSKWVNKEVQYFVKLKRTKRIIPFIVEGNPNSVDKDVECCTPLLKKLLGQRELLGISINEMGFDAAAVKVVSRMFHVKYSSLWNRYEKEKEEEQRKLKEERDNLFRANVRFVSERALAQIEKRNSYVARKALLELYGKTEFDYPYVAEADRALRRALSEDSMIWEFDRTFISSVSISNHGDIIAIATYVFEDSILLYCSHNGQSLGVIKDISHCAYTKMFFSRDDKIMIATTRNSIRIYEMYTYSLIHEWHDMSEQNEQNFYNVPYIENAHFINNEKVLRQFGW